MNAAVNSFVYIRQLRLDCIPMKRLLAFLLILLCISPAAVAKGAGGHSGHSSHSSGSRTEHVNGYYRKDGTYVHSYDRSAPGTASGTSSYSASTTYTRNHLAEGFTEDPSVQRDKRGRIKRSGAAKDAFKREQPCPATGKSTGRCPGYVIDHVRPLECGGADAQSNMQWQTTAEGKGKDKTERYCR
jgi:hypothetical protein